MNWTTPAAWAFGFFTPFIICACFMIALSGIGGWFWIPENYRFSTTDMWSGGWLFVGVAIIVTIVVIQVSK